jgi:site-specific DNA-methyltransferase (adenine-specific)
MKIDLRQGDCLEVMKEIPNKSVDMNLCDLPYGTTACKWDNVIPFEPLWEQYNRIIKDNGAIVLFGSEPFSSKLRLSNLKMYRYDWIWQKTIPSNFLCVKKQPAKNYEKICVFYKKQPLYNPIMREGKPYKNSTKALRTGNQQKYGAKQRTPIENKGTRYPTATIFFSNGNNKNIHPTQKPVALLEYLIKTYTNENDLVLDNCMGSGSTGVACVKTNRNFIGIELDENYFNIAKERIMDGE